MPGGGGEGGDVGGVRPEWNASRSVAVPAGALTEMGTEDDPPSGWEEERGIADGPEDDAAWAEGLAGVPPALGVLGCEAVLPMVDGYDSFETAPTFRARDARSERWVGDGMSCEICMVNYASFRPAQDTHLDSRAMRDRYAHSRPLQPAHEICRLTRKSARGYTERQDRARAGRAGRAWIPSCRLSRAPPPRVSRSCDAMRVLARS